LIFGVKSTITKNYLVCNSLPLNIITITIYLKIKDFYVNT